MNIDLLDGLDYLLKETREIASWCVNPFNDPGLTREEALHALEAYLRQERCSIEACPSCRAVFDGYRRDWQYG